MCCVLLLSWFLSIFFPPCLLPDFLLSGGGGPPSSVAHIFRVQFQSFHCSALSPGRQYISFCLFLLLLPFHDNIWHRRSCKKYIYLWYIYQSYKILSHKNCESFFLLALKKNIFTLLSKCVGGKTTTTTTAKREKTLLRSTPAKDRRHFNIVVFFRLWFTENGSLRDATAVRQATKSRAVLCMKWTKKCAANTQYNSTTPRHTPHVDDRWDSLTENETLKLFKRLFLFQGAGENRCKCIKSCCFWLAVEYFNFIISIRSPRLWVIAFSVYLAERGCSWLRVEWMARGSFSTFCCCCFQLIELKTAK